MPRFIGVIAQKNTCVHLRSIMFPLFFPLIGCFLLVLYGTV